MSFQAIDDLPVQDVSSICCVGCGGYDASLRYSSHRVVVSTLVSAAESAHGGIWCARCRGLEAARATAISLLAGWWSPRGPAKTLAALRSNLKGGDQHPGINAEMLRALARRENERGNLALAAMFGQAAHSIRATRENSRLLDELRKSGHQGIVPASPWRFAPYAPIIVLIIVIAGLGVRLTTRHPDETALATPVQQASALKIEPSAATAPPKILRTDRSWLAHATADEMEKQLTPESDITIARAYFIARLREAKEEIPARVRRGDDLTSIQLSIRALGDVPAVVPLFKDLRLRDTYENLTAVLGDATRDYHGGGSLDAIQRTAGEELRVTQNVANAAVKADMIGHTERADALADDVEKRAQSLVEMKRDLNVRNAVMASTANAIDKCLAAAR
jgi:hypothetical protein